MAFEEGQAKDVFRFHLRKAWTESAVGFDVFPDREVQDQRLVWGTVGDVAGHILPGEGVVAALPEDGALTRGVESAEHPKQAGFSTSVGTQDPVYISFFYGKRQVFHCRNRTKPFGKVIYSKYWLHKNGFLLISCPYDEPSPFMLQ